jgi:hypothetical protein
MHREIIADPAKVKEIEAAMQDKEVLSWSAEVVMGQFPNHGQAIMIRDATGKVILLSDGAALSEAKSAVVTLDL